MIDVVVTTYQPEGSMRAKYMRATIESLVRHLKCEEEEFRLIIADDGSPDQDMNFMMCRYVERFGWPNPIITNALRAGIGGSLNLALGHVIGPWIYTTDDWMLVEDLDVTIPMYLLMNYDVVRVGAIHPNLTCYTKFEENTGWWLELDVKGGGFTFATRPFLTTKKFYDKIGPFKEQCTAYDMEIDYCGRVTNTTSRLAHIGTLEGPFVHIGENVNSIGAQWP